MAGANKLVTAGGGGVILTPASSIASDVTVNIPSRDCTLRTTGESVITSGTAVASTSGTSIDFTSIPSWVKRITIQFDSVSTSASSYYQVQLGTSGGVQTTSYACVSSYNGAGAANGSFTATSGFAFYNDTATDTYTGQVVLTLLNSATNLWVASGWLGMSRGFTMFTSGSKTLSGTLDRVRITTVAGTPTFDAGSINILYE